MPAHNHSADRRCLPPCPASIIVTMTRAPDELIPLANGRGVPAEAVEALDRLAFTWPGATLEAARPAVVAAVMEALGLAVHEEYEAPTPLEEVLTSGDPYEDYRRGWEYPHQVPAGASPDFVQGANDRGWAGHNGSSTEFEDSPRALAKVRQERDAQRRAHEIVELTRPADSADPDAEEVPGG